MQIIIQKKIIYYFLHRHCMQLQGRCIAQRFLIFLELMILLVEFIMASPNASSLK